MAEDWTKFPPVPAPVQAVRQAKATLIGVMGPPGSGKTRTVLRLMRGVQRVYPGRVVMIDTEAGRSSLYAPLTGQPATPDHPTDPTYDFDRIDLGPPFRGDRCWAAIKAALAQKPAALAFDNISDEHTGEGGYLDWHDQEVERVGGNEWGAWSRPSAARKKLISGIVHVAPPPILFFTFIAEEKTDQVNVKDERTGREKKKVINKGWTPVAPLLILKTLDLTCILPWDSKGTPIWESRKLPYEDFIRKWPDHLTRLMTPGQITEDHGEALARWAAGQAPLPGSPGDRAAQAQPGAKSGHSGPAPGNGAQLLRLKELLDQHVGSDIPAREAAVLEAFGADRRVVSKMPADQLEIGLATLQKNLEGLAALRAEAQREREPGEDTE